MTDHALDRAQLAEAVGNDIADMAHFWMLRKFQFLEPAREQFEIIVDPWLSYCTEPSQNEIMAYNMAFTDWLLFERPYRHGKALLELYVDEPPASLSPASLKRLKQVRDTQYFSRFGILDKDPANGMVALKDTRADRRFDVYDPHIVQKEHWSDGAIAVRLACVDDVWLTAGQLYLYDIACLSDTAVDGPGAVHPEDLQDGFDTSCISFFLRKLARSRQVLCVTHLPQVASCADNQWQVIKHTENGKTTSALRVLTPAERIDEVARMLGGLTITPATRQAAGEMLGMNAALPGI